MFRRGHHAGPASPLEPRPRLGAGARIGFSLIETMIAILIVSMGSIATISMLTATHIQNDMAQERARAHQMVSEEMERVRLELFPRANPGQQVTVWDNGTPDDESDDSVGTLEVVMRDLDGTELTVAPIPARRVQVEVTLTWNPRGRLQSKTMRETVMTYLAP